MNLNIDFENEDVCKKLQKIFLDKKNEINAKNSSEKESEKEWADYLFKYGVFVMGIKDVYKHCNARSPHFVCIENIEGELFEESSSDELKYYLNRGMGLDRAIVADRIIDDFWYIVPTKFAEKALALGRLP